MTDRQPVSLADLVIAYANNNGSKEAALDAMRRAQAPLSEQLKVSIAVERARKRARERGKSK